MLAVLVEIDLHIPAARSLKDKRSAIRRLQSRLRDDLGVSVAEIAHQDLWQRCTLGVAIACSDATTGRGVVQDVERILARAVEVEVLDLHVEVVQSEPDGFSMAGVGLTAGAGDPRIGVDGVTIDGATVDVGVDPAGLEHLLVDEWAAGEGRL